MKRLFVVAVVVVTVLVAVAAGGPWGAIGPWLFTGYLGFRAAPGVRADLAKIHAPHVGWHFGRTRGERL